MASHKALGRGLNALFSSTQTLPKEEPKASKNDKTPEVTDGVSVLEIPINSIKPNRHQPRKHFDPASLEELAQSIKVNGLQQPLVVTLVKGTNDHELVVGERRLRAAKLAGLATVPCIVKEFSNQQRFVVALIENLQRENLNSMDEANAIDGLMKEYFLTQDQVAKALGKSRSTVGNILRFLRLHEKVQDALRDGTITEGHAKVLAGLQEHAEQLRFLNLITKDKLTVRDLEHQITPKAAKKKPAGSGTLKIELGPEARKYEEDLQRLLGRRVEIQSNGKKGWIRFAFYSPWDLEMLLKRLELIQETSGEPGEQDLEKDY